MSVKKTFGKSCLILKAERTEPKCIKKFRSQLNQYKLCLQESHLDINFNDQVIQELQKLLTDLMYEIMKSYPAKMQENLYAQANIRLTGIILQTLSSTF